MSPIIYEVLDVGTGITDATGSLVSSGAGIPSFVGVLDKSVKAILLLKAGCIAPGDIFVLNDPNCGGVTHLNDVVIAKPVFWEGVLVAWVASIAHWGDIGGRTPGSMATDTTEIIAEGLRLPIVKLFENGEQNAAVFDIIRTNSRLPDTVAGDLWAQVAAAEKATAVIETLCHRYGTDALQAAIAETLKLGAARSGAPPLKSTRQHSPLIYAMQLRNQPVREIPGAMVQSWLVRSFSKRCAIRTGLPIKARSNHCKC